MDILYQELLKEIVTRALNDLQRLLSKEESGKKLTRGELEEGIELFEFFSTASKELLYCFSREFNWNEVPELILAKSPQITAAVKATKWESYEGRKVFA